MKLIKKEYNNYLSPLKKSKNSKYLSQILLKMKNFVISNNKLNITKDNKETIQSLLYKSREKFFSPSNDIETFSPNLKKNNIFQLYNVANNLRNKLNNKKTELELLKSLSLKQKSKKHFNSKILSNSKELILSLINEEKKDTKKKIQININELSNNSLTRNMNYKSLFFIRSNSPKLRSLSEDNNISKIKKEKEKIRNYAIKRNSIIQEIILNEKSYEKLNYDGRLIFKDYKYYNKFIKKRIAKLKQEIPSEEKVHRVLEKIYENSKYNKPLITLNSLSVSFESKGNNHIFYIPFEFLPLFYYKNMTYLKMLLISIFKIDINYDNILVDYSELSNVLENSKMFHTDIEEINKTEKKENNPKSNNSNKELMFIRRKIQKNLTNVKINIFNFSSFYKNNKNNNFISHDSSNMNNITKRNSKTKRRNSLYDLKEKCFTPRHNDTRKILFNPLKKNLIEKMSNKLFVSKLKENENNSEIKEETKEEEDKNLYKCSFSKFLFEWKTPKYNYNIIVKVPEAVFQINKKIIRTKIDIELIFYLLENSFRNWDFYISKYIFAYKKSIKNVESLISIKSTSNLLSNQIKILPEINSNRKNYLLKEEININKIKSGNIYNLTDKCKKFEFIYTDNDNRNYLKILHNFYMTAHCKSINPNKKFIFEFNFLQMRKLNKILRIQGLNYFLNKLVYIDREDLSIKFRYDELSSFSNEKYSILEKQNPNLNSNQISLKINERNKDIINIIINFPILETIKYQNLNDNLYSDNCFESNYDDSSNKGISLNLLNELCHKNINKWPDLLLKNH